LLARLELLIYRCSRTQYAETKIRLKTMNYITRNTWKCHCKLNDSVD